MKPNKASFNLREADESVFDIGSVAMACQVDFDREKKCWRAWDEHGNEALSDDQAHACAKLFAQRLEADR